MSGRIDDPVEASFGAWPKSGGLGKTLGEAALSVTGIGFPPVALAKIIYDHFQNVNRYNRIEYLLEAVRLGLKQLETQVGGKGKGKAGENGDSAISRSSDNGLRGSCARNKHPEDRAFGSGACQFCNPQQVESCKRRCCDTNSG